jgi:hypothetical protein
MTFRMYDSITPANLPPGADAYARNTSIEHLVQVNADVPLATFAKHYLTTNQ